MCIRDSSRPSQRRRGGGEDEEPAVAFAPAAVAPGGPTPRTVRESNKEVDDKRKNAKNTLELCTMLLATRAHRRTMAIMCYLSRPFRKSFGLWQTMMKTQAGTLQLHCQCAV